MSERARTLVTVGTVGHVDRPDSTLTSALLKVLAKKYGGSARAPGESSVSPSRVEYNTATRHYVHIDDRGRPDYVKNLFAEGKQMDAAVLVINANEGAKKHHEDVLLGRKAGVPRVLVFLDKCDEADEELAELVEMEVRELLSENDFQDENTPVIRGSGLKALEGVAEWEEKILDLANALDTYIPQPDPDRGHPFLMPIDEVSSGPGSVVVAKGRAESGIVKVGDKVEIVGLKQTLSATCAGVEMFGKMLDEGGAGENLGVHLRGVVREDVQRGQVLSKPGAIRPHRKFEADIYVLSKTEGGGEKPILKGSRLLFYFRTTDVTGVVELPAGVDKVMPGDNVTTTVSLIAPIAMEDGLRFAIRDSGRTIGAGAVTRILD